MTIAEQLRQEGRQQGIQQGMQQGIQAGEATLLTRQIIFRFRELPAKYQQRIAEADAETLLKWGERLFSANNLDEVFA